MSTIFLCRNLCSFYYFQYNFLHDYFVAESLWLSSIDIYATVAGFNSPRDIIAEKKEGTEKWVAKMM